MIKRNAFEELDFFLLRKFIKNEIYFSISVGKDVAHC